LRSWASPRRLALAHLLFRLVNLFTPIYLHRNATSLDGFRDAPLRSPFHAKNVGQHQNREAVPKSGALAWLSAWKRAVVERWPSG